MRQEARELDANSEWISECAECVKYGERDGKGVKKGRNEGLQLLTKHGI